MTAAPPRVVIVAEHASARFGGEAALPLHYFRVLRSRGVPTWLVTHARTRSELEAAFPGDGRILYVEDTAWHRWLDRVGRRMPAAVAYLTVGYLSRLSTQLVQRRMVRRLVAAHGIEVVHQPMPVSPREPSLLFDLGAPVVIGPMNGGMDYPPGFGKQRGPLERTVLRAGRRLAWLLNWLVPGKRRATTLLVANRRTEAALPGGCRGSVVHLVENGVDLAVWTPTPAGDGPAVFVFTGRLVHWKGVDLLLAAFARARTRAPMRLWIVGDGVERDALQRLSRELALATGDPDAPGAVHFFGWQPQSACAELVGRADVLVLPSLLECGGAVVLEAMALAKPVIANAWGGPQDYLDDRCGVLIEPDGRAATTDAWEGALVSMALDRSRREAMGRAGRERVVREFDWEHKTTRMLGVYDEAITRAGTARR